MLDQSSTSDDRKSAREARAQAYFDQDLRKQRDWYSDRATLHKSRSQLLSMFVIVAGVATTFVQMFGQEQHWWVPVLTAALGGAITMTEGWQRIARYSETWISYRTASERMKREFRLYVNGAGTYRALDEEGAYLQFVENIEAILAEEQQIYWQAQRGLQGKDNRENEQPHG
jgi:Protein of unknown function (DUF4231)